MKLDISENKFFDRVDHHINKVYKDLDLLLGTINEYNNALKEYSNEIRKIRRTAG